MARDRSARSLVSGIILIGLGVLFLVARFVGEEFFALTWPWLVLGAGSLFFLGMLLGGPQAAPLAIPGSVISTVGLILLLQNTFGHWESWSYAWTLILTSAGAGIYIKGWWGQDERSRQVGVRLLLLGAILFVVFGGFFEFALGFSNFGVNAQMVWAGGLILLGVFLVARSSGLLRRQH